MAKFIFYDDKIINIMLKDEKPSGGAAVQAYSWIRGLKENGHEVQVITMTSKSNLLKDECSDIKLLPLFDRKKGIKWLRWIYYRLPYIYRIIKANKPDYLYQGIPSWQSFIMGIICYKLQIKFILRISNDYLIDNRLYKKSSRLHGFFLNLGIKLTYCILCQNDYQYEIIKAKYPNKVAFKISNPIFTRHQYLPSNSNFRNYIAWIGLFQYQKNIPLLYDIACALANENFVIAGNEDVGCDPKTAFFLKKLKSLPNVKFVGFLERDEILSFLGGAKYLLNTSFYEGFSNTFLEAMVAGTPIITSCNVNPDGIITSNNLGIVYKDLTDLQLKYASVSRMERMKMSKNVIEYVSKNHNYKIMAQNLYNYLQMKKQDKYTNVSY